MSDQSYRPTLRASHRNRFQPRRLPTLAHWIVRCDCGNEKTINGKSLGRPTLSCGCLQRDYAKAPKPNRINIASAQDLSCTAKALLSGFGGFGDSVDSLQIISHTLGSNELAATCPFLARTIRQSHGPRGLLWHNVAPKQIFNLRRLLPG
jgi:hypothetical protein